MLENPILFQVHFMLYLNAKNYGFEVVNKYARYTAFTQGLQFIDGILYESNGRYGEST
jgi:glutamine cyclotransferase